MHRHRLGKQVSVEVGPVTTRRDLREFIELPYRLHATARQWTPPLRIERHAFLSRRFNAFFRHGEARCFLARRGGRSREETAHRVAWAAVEKVYAKDANGTWRKR